MRPPAPLPAAAGAALLLLLLAAPALALPLPSQRQLDFMELGRLQFFHFSIPTFWDPPVEYLYTRNPTYHNCVTTVIDRGNQTGGYYPCLDPLIFAPTDFSADDWMQTAAALGSREICLTAHHEGGFTLWPSNYSDYGVRKSLRWRGGSGDVLRDFADAANRWGIKICYYLNPTSNSYHTLVEKLSPEKYIEAELGMIREVLTTYGPVNRFWFDGTRNLPNGTNETDLWQRVYALIREVSPPTLISPYRGDVCATIGSLYTRSAPAPNSSSDTGGCAPPTEDGQYLHPSEQHGITLQEGPDGNTVRPTVAAATSPGHAQPRPEVARRLPLVTPALLLT